MSGGPSGEAGVSGRVEGAQLCQGVSRVNNIPWSGAGTSVGTRTPHGDGMFCGDRRPLGDRTPIQGRMILGDRMTLGDRTPIQDRVSLEDKTPVYDRTTLGERIPPSRTGCSLGRPPCRTGYPWGTEIPLWQGHPLGTGCLSGTGCPRGTGQPLCCQGVLGSPASDLRSPPRSCHVLLNPPLNSQHALMCK